jgi:hypothetical protein
MATTAPFTSDELRQLEALVASAPSSLSMTEFRSHFPGHTLTRCDVSDMGDEEPYRRFPAVHLYLVDGRDHCWHITNDPACATGVVLAEKPRLQ